MKKIVKDDPLFAAIVGLIAIVALWLLMTPLVPSVAMATMRRFHLRSSSYGAWAMQFPIPAMYNFANRYRVSKLNFPPRDSDSSDIVSDQSSLTPTSPTETRPWRYLNHFPTRIITFADGRYRYMRDGDPFRFELETKYGAQTLRSTYELFYRDKQRFELRLIDE